MGLYKGLCRGLVGGKCKQITITSNTYPFLEGCIPSEAKFPMPGVA